VRSIAVKNGVAPSSTGGAALPGGGWMNRTHGQQPAVSRTDLVRVLMVDNHDVIRRGLRDFLHDHPGIAVVGEAATGAEAITEAARLRPDVVVMDMHLPDGFGIEACRAIRAVSADSKVLVLSARSDPDALLAAVMAGASGVLRKDSSLVGLREAVVTVADGGSLLDPQLATGVLDRLREAAELADEETFPELSPQEERILDMIADGMTNAEIAGALSLAEKTIKNYVSEIYAKLNVERRSQAAAVAVHRRLRRSP
jgi:two-component system, NarL family, response regulator DevR